PLGEGDEVDAGDAGAPEDLLHGVQLPLAAVDDDEVGLGEALLLLRAELGMAAGDDLLQAGAVVRPVNSADLVAASAAAVRLAVDDDEVGLGEALLFRRAELGKAAGEHLLQAGEVVRPFHRADLEAAVAAAVLLAVDKDDHRPDLVHPADVGNVVALHAAGIA